MIFEPTQPLHEKADQADAKRARAFAEGNPLAEHLVTGDFYRKFYARALRRLDADDMLGVDEAAQRLSISVDSYRQKAATGDAVLIQIEGREVVPVWLFDAKGQIDQLKLDIAREIAREFTGQSNKVFSFLDYLDFMDEKIEFRPAIPDSLRAAFQAVGWQDYNVSLKATVNQLADQREINRDFLKILVDNLAWKMTRMVGQGVNECYLSDEFIAKYDPQRRRPLRRSDLEPSG